MTKKTGNPVGRPRKDATKQLSTRQAINSYRDRMLNSPRSKKVLDSIFNAALDDNHKNQAAAWKIVVDRIAPVSAFDPSSVSGSGRAALEIKISGVGGVVVSPEAPAIDADFEEVSDGAED